jgi:hypothetical protein
MACRIGALVPFVPFTKKEQVAFVEDEIDNACTIFAKAPVDEGEIKLVGKFEYTVAREVIVSHTADEYYYMQRGATSLKDVFKGEIHDTINNRYLEGNDLQNTVGYFRLCSNVGSEDISLTGPSAIESVYEIIKCRVSSLI